MPKQSISERKGESFFRDSINQCKNIQAIGALLSMLLKVRLSMFRKSSTMKAESSVMRNQQLDAKRKKTKQVQGVLAKMN